MKRKIFIIVALAMFIAMSLGSAQAYISMYGPTETVYLDETKAEDGYFLYSIGGATYLIDKKGRVCHSWPVGGFRLISDGRLVTNAAGGFQIVDWDGNTVWSATTPTDNPKFARAHHDYEPVVDPNTGEVTSILYVGQYNVSYAEAKAAGADDECVLAEFDRNGNPNQAAATPDAIYEMDMNGDIIWYWSFWHHVVQSHDPNGYVTLPDDSTRSTYQAAVELYPDYLKDQRSRIQDFGRLNINMDDQRRNGLTLDWTHVNSMSYNTKRDEIVLNDREHGEFFVIDHSLTTEQAYTEQGDFVYRWGNPSNYGMGLPPDWRQNGHEQLWGAHNVHFIQEGYNGEGHILIFDNGSKRVQGADPVMSSSFEIDPFGGGNPYTSAYIRQENGGYTPGPDIATQYGGYGTLSNQVVWKWSTKEINVFSVGFHSAHISGTQRCKNGNTILVAGENGEVVEVTPGGEVVWNYICPVVSAGFGQPAVAKAIHGPADAPNLFRGYPIPKDDPRLAGKDLTPGATLTGRIPASLGEGFKYPAKVTYTGWGAASVTAEGGGGSTGGGGGGGGAAY